jgi:hypothetical protein
VNNLHTLTALTGRDSGANRTIIVQGFEARRRTVVVAAIGALPALLVTAILWGFIGQYAILALPAVEGLTFWLIETRTRGGLQQRTYTSLLDKRRSDAGKFYMCGRVVDPDLNELGSVVTSSVPSPWLTAAPAPDANPEVRDDKAAVAPLPVRPPAPPAVPATQRAALTWDLPARAAAPAPARIVAPSQSAADIMFGARR